MKRGWLYWNTVRYLRPQQILYQLINRFRPKPSLSIGRLPKTGVRRLHFPPPDKPVSVQGRTFTFLNKAVSFPGAIDWNYAGEGRLWAYNLNYFDFLIQPGLDRDQGLDLIRQFIDKTGQLNDGLEPYPTSLRIINWIRFLSFHDLQVTDIQAHLRAQVNLLENRLEYHLGGNHLLENAFALVLAAIFFQDRVLYRKASALLLEQLREQVLADGGHYERSTMYHQILLDRLLDVCCVLRQPDGYQDPVLESVLLHQARRMLGWLEAVTFSNGNMPLVNDAAQGIAPSASELGAKARLLGISSEKAVLSDSGYRLLKTQTLELLADVGAVGPGHQPGHAHADTFSFELQVRGKPVIVDAGTSTYEANARRQWERSTAAHNTVQVGETDSSEVWGGFRVARRATVTLVQDSATSLRAQHNGYARFGCTHERSWDLIDAGTIRITDRLLGPGKVRGVARLHFHPSVRISIAGKELMAGPLQIRFLNVSIGQVTVGTYEYAVAFNQLQVAPCIEIAFLELLEWCLTVVE
ncbi:heparinase II/III family protein [Larkinella bovis]|uniref:Heparinase II/III family protein n=1 Tax=Larkinella bovis TaxID=683041 RepID=A0ABW0I9Y6_9BACT